MKIIDSWGLPPYHPCVPDKADDFALRTLGMEFDDALDLAEALGFAPMAQPLTHEVHDVMDGALLDGVWGFALTIDGEAVPFMALLKDVP
jgi:hypothetical protein